ncbi:MAG: biotin/lipoyl-containing protein, partial [Actinomycetota bacterium]
MPVTVTMPQLGETVTEGTVLSWAKQVGEQIAEDEVLLEISTDKVDTEMPSPASGVIVEILVPAGETVAVGTPIVVIGEAGEAPAPTPQAMGPTGTPAMGPTGTPAMGPTGTP